MGHHPGQTGSSRGAGRFSGISRGAGRFSGNSEGIDGAFLGCSDAACSSVWLVCSGSSAFCLGSCPGFLFLRNTYHATKARSAMPAADPTPIPAKAPALIPDSEEFSIKADVVDGAAVSDDAGS